MKRSLALIIGVALAASAMADIQAPPASNQGPTQKLGRGISNLLYGSSELINSMTEVNYEQGNSAAFGYGVVRGIGRTLARAGYGLYDIFTFPWPTAKGKYAPPYRSDIPWINSGYSEYPPELGFETRYTYSRLYQRDPN